MFKKTMLLVIRALAVTLVACSAGQTPGTGVISGRLAYPSEETPAMTIVLFELNARRPTEVVMPSKRTSYVAQVPPGDYVIFAIPEGATDPALVGAHTSYSLCNARALSREAPDTLCTTGQPREISVAAGARIADVNIDDWYLEEHVALQLRALLNPDQ
jgi:hypothetical protein